MLMAKKGLKILVVDLSFDQPIATSEPGLLQYLEGAKSLQISKQTVMTGWALVGCVVMQMSC